MSNKKKLFLISPMLHQGGFERVCITTARVLEDIFDITIVIFSDADIAFDITGLRIVNLDVPAKEGTINKLFNIAKRVKSFRKLIVSEKPDLIYSFGLTAGLINALSKSNNRKDASLRWVGLRSYLDVEEELMMKLFINKADRIICCSKEIEEFVKNHYNTLSTATLYNLYDLDKIVAQSANAVEDYPENFEKRYTIVSMGRDDYKKGYWHMIKAFKLAHDAVPAARMVILGDGEFVECRRLAHELELDEFIFFAGMQTDPYSYLSKAGVYLLTSNTEGFPNALVEGMCLKLPAVATNCKTGPAEILINECKNSVSEIDRSISEVGGIRYSDYGILIQSMDSTENYDSEDMDEERICADVLIRLLTNDDLYEEYSQKALEGAARFDYASYKKNFVEIAKNDGIAL